MTAIVCRGRDLDYQANRSHGQPCGRTFPPPRYGTAEDAARAAGWRIGTTADGTPDALCPRCAKPDPTTVGLCTELARR